MSYVYKNSQLSWDHGRGEPLPLLDLVEKREEAFYLYDLVGLRERVQRFKRTFPDKGHIHYAVKANAHSKILSLMREEGLAVDVVSWGEMNLALKNGFRGQDVVFSGVGKTRSEIQQAISAGVSQINVESISELRRIGDVAEKLQKTVHVAYRLNPDVDVNTHPYIKTGFRENKFGMDAGFLPLFQEICHHYSDWIRWSGLDMHIGSQILEAEPFVDALNKGVQVMENLRKGGTELTSFDLGGGWGIRYDLSAAEDEWKIFERCMALVQQPLASLQFKGIQILCEPGRFLVARCGLLISRVEYIKKTPHKNFAILNTGMHHLLRPALYQAKHRIVPLVDRSQGVKEEVYDFVGPICESADVLAKDWPMAGLQEGDWVAICDTGAYGAVLANTYNQHPLPEEVVLEA